MSYNKMATSYYYFFFFQIQIIMDKTEGGEEGGGEGVGHSIPDVRNSNGFRSIVSCD